MKHTLESRLIAGILSLGTYRIDKAAQSRKYTVFDHCEPHKLKLYVGHYGALRKGSTVASSVSLGCPALQSSIYAGLLNAGDRALAAESIDTSVNLSPLL